MKLVGTSDDQSNKSADTEKPLPKRGKFSQHLGETVVGTPQTTVSIEEKAKQELMMYKQLPVPNIHDNPLKWWKSEEAVFQTSLG